MHKCNFGDSAFDLASLLVSQMAHEAPCALVPAQENVGGKQGKA